MNEWTEFAGRSSVYGWITIIGILIGGWFWSRKWKSRPGSFAIFVGAICGAFLGAKLMYVLAEGWMVIGQERWLIQWLVGKSIVGALLGGYAGVEMVKRWIGHREPTGDWFAVGVPLSIAVGRLGCLSYGCCPGKLCDTPAWWAIEDATGASRWPAVPLELGFNLLFVAAILPFALRKAGKGQLFHAYLIAYGLFRFWHEFHRATPKLSAEISGYQVGAAALVGIGVWRGWVRRTARRKRDSHSGKDDPPTESDSHAEQH